MKVIHLINHLQQWSCKSIAFAYHFTLIIAVNFTYVCFIFVAGKSMCIAVKIISWHCILFMVYFAYKLWNQIHCILLDLFLMLHHCKQTDEWVNVKQYFYHFQVTGSVIPTLLFLYQISLPNALYNLTKFRENSSKGIGVMGCIIMCLWTDRWMDRHMDSMLIAISPQPIGWGIMKFNKRSWWYSYINLNAKCFTFIWKF